MPVTEDTITALARKWAIDIDLATPPAAASWAPLLGVQDFKPNNAPTLQDDGVYDDLGFGSMTKTGLAWTVEVDVVRRQSVTNAQTYDPGQERARLQSELFGAAGVVHARWYDRFGGVEAYEGFAEVEWTPKGGKRTDIEIVAIKLTGRGARTVITNPLAVPAGIPTVDSVTPNTGTAAGGTLIDLRGSQFIGLAGATAVKVGGVNALSYIVISDSRITAITGPHAAGAVNATVTSPAGTSPTGAQNAYTYV